MTALAGVLCPSCRAALDAELACAACGQRYPRLGRIPVLLPQAELQLRHWRGQLGLLLERGQATLAGLSGSAAAPGLLPATRARLLALGAAVREQVGDFERVLGPLLAGPAEPAAGLPRGVVEYIGYLYRDWAWPSVGYRENDAALTRVSQLLGGRNLGRTLLLGAGACGLAYELQRRHAASPLVALDIDPFLLAPAEQIMRGQSVRLTEASLKVLEAGDVARAWTLSAPAALSPELFQCVLADGLAPPFAPASFDSVVTPWFIDQVPRDLPALLTTLRGLLRPGGLWLNQGPLIYPEQVPFERRYCQDELFELAHASGFRALGHARDSLQYLVSPLSGHGKIETVLTCVFQAGTD